MRDETGRIAFQGARGAYSHQACTEAFPFLDGLACNSFEGAIAAVKEGRADLAMLPVENSTYGRIADIHHLLPESGLHIIGEHFVRVHANLLGGARHPARSGEDRAQPGAAARPVPDVSRPARHRAADRRRHRGLGRDRRRDRRPRAGGARLRSRRARIYGLDVLARHIEDQSNNTTRFLVMSPEPRPVPRGEALTTFVFRVRNIPAALYKAMGGFATNGVNMTKLESYMVNGHFTATQFYADIEGHPDDPPVARALDELAFFTTQVQVLGVYAPHPFRHDQKPAAAE